MPKALVEFLQLPIPGQTLAENREIKVEEYTMQIYSHLLPDLKLTQLLSTHKVTMPMLKDRLASYGCPTSGSRSQLVQRLRDFAADKDNWVSIFQAHVKRKRGDISGARLNKTSSQRIIAQFGEKQGTNEYQSKKSGERAPQPLQDLNIVQNSSWAAAVLAANWSQYGKSCGSNNEIPTECAEQTQSSPLANSHSLLPAVEDTVSGSTGIDVRLRRVERGIASLKQELFSKLDDLHNHLQLQCHSDRALQQPPGTSDTTTTRTLAHATSPTTSAPLTLNRVTLPATSIDPMKLAVVKLGGEDFAIDRTSVPDPPAMHFSNDISGLFQHWNSSDCLVVNGRGIPIKYWPEFYQAKRGFKAGAWKAIRVEWGNWKFIVEERERHSTEDLFWAKFSDPNSHMRFGFQQILTILKRERAERDAQCVADANQFFNGHLGHTDANGAFTYTSKLGASVVMTKVGDIARNWRSLLVRDPLIAARWSVQQLEAQQPTTSAPT